MRFARVIICLLVFLAAGVYAGKAYSADVAWKLMGRTKDNNFLVYYDTANVKYLRKDYVEVRFKRERSEEGIEQFRKDFYASVKEAEAKAGNKVGGPVEPVMKALLERETKEYDMVIDCSKNELRVLPATMDKINFVVVYAIEAGTATENIRNEVCPKH